MSKWFTAYSAALRVVGRRVRAKRLWRYSEVEKERNWFKMDL